MKIRLWSDKFCVCFLVARLASSIPLALQAQALQSGTWIPPLPFPPDEDISSCHLTSTIESPTQPWHDASFDPIDPIDPIDDNDNLGVTLANQSLPLPLSSYQALASAPVAVTRKRNDDNQPSTDASNTICSTVAAFTFTNLPIYPLVAFDFIRTPLNLSPGFYVFSFTNNYGIHLVGVITRVAGQRGGTLVAHNLHNAETGTVAFVLTQTSEVTFAFDWDQAQRPPGGQWLTSGEAAVFRIGPG